MLIINNLDTEHSYQSLYVQTFSFKDRKYDKGINHNKRRCHVIR